MATQGNDTTPKTQRPAARMAPPPVRSSLKRPATSKPAPRKRIAVDGSKLEGSKTSLASRKRRQPTCSIASLRNLEDEETLESDFIGYFGATSENHWTWGKTETKPISATRKRGRAPRFKKKSDGDFFDLLYGGDIPLEDRIPNSPDRSFFLRFPLEIRERIYGKFLLYPKPIVAKFDLTTIERDNLRCHPILRVCRQISEEASAFIYRANIFRVILREPRISYHLHESFIIYPKFLSLFRDVIIEGQKDNYNLDWYEHTSVVMEKLVESKTNLNSLTLVFVPKRVGMTTTAVGLEKHPITFADFLLYNGRLMKAFRKLPCLQLNIIIKRTYPIPAPPQVTVPTESITQEVAAVTTLPTSTASAMDSVDTPNLEPNSDSDPVPDLVPDLGPAVVETPGITITKRFLFQLNLKYLARSAIEETNLRNTATVAIGRRNAFGILQDLKKVKARFEAIFEDDIKSVDRGWCRLMGEDERIADVIAGEATESCWVG